jgi:Ca-activated chloride channel family protein
MARLIRIGIAVLAGSLSLTLAAPIAHALLPPKQSELAPTMLVLDASGSMLGADPAGGTKMDAAKRAVRTLVDATPNGASVGLAAYGTSTSNSDAERDRGCQDVTVLNEPGPIDKAAMGAAVDRLTPSGFTPIGRALQVAAEALPQEGPRSIVLVSDGEDTCAPPEPCEVVRTLAGQGVDLVVHTVGFGVDDVARAQLSCVAQATGGTYTDAPDADALQRTLPRVTTTAMRNYEPSGTPITGTPTSEAAPDAVPGQHLDTIGQYEKRYYAVDVPEGATAYFSATVSIPLLQNLSKNAPDFANALSLRTYGEAGEDCNAFEFQQTSDSSGGAALTVATTWDGATEQKTGSSGAGDRCRGGGRYTFALEWFAVSESVPARLPVELLVGIEPAVTDAGPEAALPAAELAEPTGDPRLVVGGGSFNVASTLDGSGSYSDVLRRGEFVFYRVRLDWGQGLAYRVRFGETPGTSLANVSPVWTRVYAPTREEIDWDFASYTGPEQVLPSNERAIATVPARYSNRASDNTEAQSQSTAGWYYISVQVSPTVQDPGAAAPLPVRLDVSVTGSPEEGPRYAFSSPEAERSGLFGENRTPVAAQPPAAQPPGVGNAASSTALSPAGWVAIAVAAVLVVALVVVGLVVRRRRTAPGARPR